MIGWVIVVTVCLAPATDCRNIPDVHYYPTHAACEAHKQQFVKGVRISFARRGVKRVWVNAECVEWRPT